MATSYQAFLIELYEEYLEEASFLYEQRLGLLDDPEVTWRDVGEFEERFEAHIDGLVVGEDLALEVCRRRAAEGDFGELHAAVRVFCRQNRKEWVWEALEGLDPGEPEKLRAAADALKHEAPAAWEAELIERLGGAGRSPAFPPVLAAVGGYRRLPAGSLIADSLAEMADAHREVAAWSLGRLREQGGRRALLGYLIDPDEALASAAAVALLRLGDRQVLDYCLQVADAQPWAYLPLSLGGGPAAAAAVLGHAARGQPDPLCLRALGVFGQVEAVPHLVRALERDDAAEAAAEALNLITGAGLLAEVFVPEPVEEDELFEEELENFRAGKPVTRPDGQPYGATVLRLTRDPEAWRQWWDANGGRFGASVRHRYGRPLSPEVLLTSLEDERTPNRFRRLAHEELCIRYGLDFSWEADMPVPEQERALFQLRTRAGGDPRFSEEGWYFAGERMG